MKYEDMSDFEINGRVGKIVFKLEGKEFRTKNPMNNVVEFITGFGDEREFKYFNGCNSPSDACPIIFDNRITVTPYEDENQGWFATYDTSFFIDHENPLRAAMICFLKMKDAE
jgi:hypothetical protein